MLIVFILSQQWYYVNHDHDDSNNIHDSNATHAMEISITFLIAYYYYYDHDHVDNKKDIILFCTSFLPLWINETHLIYILHMHHTKLSTITLDPLYEPNLYEISKLHPLPTSINSFVDESINFQVNRVGPRTRRMPVTYGAFDATKPTNARRVINPNIERLFKRKHVDEYAPNNIKLTDDSVSNNVTYNVTEHKQLKLVTTGQTTEANNANGNDMLQQSSSSSSLTNNNHSPSHILSTSLREISTLHLEAAHRAQILSELYNSNFVPSSIRHQQIAMAASNTNNRSTSNINDLYNVYQPVVNPLSTCNASTVSNTELQEQLRNILEKNKTSSRS